MKPMTRPLPLHGLGLALAVTLAACGQPAPPPAAPPAAQNPGPPLIPNPMPPSYIGRWAASADLCETGAWTFTDKGLVTAGEVACSFSAVTPNESGWIAEGSCTAQAPAAPATLVLNTTRTGPTRTLAVSGGPFKGPQVLVACEATGQSAAAVLVAPAGLAAAAALDSRIAAADAALIPGVVKLRGETAKVWREGAAVVRITEAAAGERSYYYRPGDLDPFLIRDADAAYALDGGRLTAVYGRDGAEAKGRADGDRAQIEGEVVTRARALRAAAR